jgi:hypothetical protein
MHYNAADSVKLDLVPEEFVERTACLTIDDEFSPGEPQYSKFFSDCEFILNVALNSSNTLSGVNVSLKCCIICHTTFLSSYEQSNVVDKFPFRDHILSQGDVRTMYANMLKFLVDGGGLRKLPH